MNNIAPKLQKCWTYKIVFKIISNVLRQPNFFCSQPSTLPNEALAKFYLSATFGSSSIISSVAPTRSSTSYTYLITNIGNRNLNKASNMITFVISDKTAENQNSDKTALSFVVRQ